ncbi:MAG TPA: radical SAM protein [Elusimicrobiales bacterium]|nr:radical SAM protein [Elusimicrobiales bacterium]
MPTIIFKATERCNANCAYCDVVRKKCVPDMSMDMLRLVFSRADAFLKERPAEHINLTWHGGEVMMLGADYLNAAARLQAECCPSTKDRIFHSVQSNLTLLDAGLVAALRNLGINNVGTSYDPQDNVRGFGSSRDSDSYNKRFFRGVSLLEENGMQWGLIYVVTKKSLAVPGELFHFLTNMTNALMINPILTHGGDELGLGITAAEYADFLGEMFKLWWPARDRYGMVRPFSEYYGYYTRRETGLVCTRGGQCGNNHMYIGPQGQLSHCSCSADWSLVDYGNIADTTIGEVFGRQKRKDWAERGAVLEAGDCKDCRFWGICHGGCPMDSLAVHGDLRHKSEWCDGTKLFLTKYFEPITGLHYEGGSGHGN